MLMSVIEGALSVPAYPELAGKRVLVTGLTSSCGVDIARAFAEHKGRLVLQFAESSEAMETVAEIVAPDALEAKVYGPVGSEADDAVQFAKTAMQAFGGLDVVINLVPLETQGLPSGGDADGRGAAGRHATHAAVPDFQDRRQPHEHGLERGPDPQRRHAQRQGSTGRSQAFAAVAKAGLTAMTRAQAEEWAGRAVRFNAIAPETGLVAGGQGLSGEPDIAAMALYLASGRGRALSGHVFEAAVA